MVPEANEQMLPTDLEGMMSDVIKRCKCWVYKSLYNTLWCVMIVIKQYGYLWVLIAGIVHCFKQIITHSNYAYNA